MLESLRTPGVVEVLGLELVQGLPVLVLEDFGAESLARLYREQRFTLGQVVGLIARIAEILGKLHDSGIIHRDVNPANILLAPATGEFELADFGSSVRMTREPPTPTDLAALSGTLAYMAPEQTGRMNRPVDHGRDQEIETLRRAFADALAGARRLVLVAGYSGIGKSTLVEELAAPAIRGPGRFIEGKFDQYRRNVPYSALAAPLAR